MSTAEKLEESPRPLVLVWAYPEGSLSSGWFRAYKRLRRTVSRAGLGIRVELLPMTALPSKLDILVVPASLERTARALTGEHECLAGSADEVQQAFDQLVARRLELGDVGYERAVVNAPVLHRGFLRARDNTDS
jgi:hypothetical protein